MVLVNVRLDAKDARRVKALRSAGVAISTLVRNVIRVEYERLVNGRVGAKKASALIAEILAALPDTVDAPIAIVDTSDRRAVRRHVAAKLKGKR